MCYGHEWGGTLGGNRWSQTFIWNNRREKLHYLRPHTAQMLLAKRILDDVRQKWRSKEASGKHCLSTQPESKLFYLGERSEPRENAWASGEAGRGRGAFLSPASGLSISSRALLARLLFTIFPNGELARRLISTLWSNSWTISLRVL